MIANDQLQGRLKASLRSRDSLYPDFKLTKDNCHQEPINRPVEIQQQGHMLVLDYSDGSYGLHAISRELPELLGYTVDDLWPMDIDRWLPSAISCAISENITADYEPLSAKPGIYLNDVEYDVVHHRYAGKTVIELEPLADVQVDAQTLISAANSIGCIDTLDQLYSFVTELIANAYGYDRVMIYQFEEDKHGVVVGESKIDSLEPFLGLHYPESDIPQIARDLFLKMRSRMITNISNPTCPLLFKPALGRSPEYLDLTYSQLRAISPIHVEYLSNMNVAGTMTLSIVVNDQLWGLVACHHGKGHQVTYESRELATVVAGLVAKRIGELQQQTRASVIQRSQENETRFINQIKVSDHYRIELIEQASSLIHLCEADGCALITIDECEHTQGLSLPESSLIEVRDWLVEKGHDEVYSTANFQQDVPVIAEQQHGIGGMLAVCVSAFSKSYLFWFRAPISQSVNWAGDPGKSYTIEYLDNGEVKLNPRQSFAKWLQVIEGCSRSWDSAEMAMADRVRHEIFKKELTHTAAAIARSNSEFLQLTYSAAHDLQQPLRTQANYLELIQEALQVKDFDELQLFASRAEVATTRMKNLVDDLLSYASIGSESKRELVDLQMLMDEVVEDSGVLIKESGALVEYEKLPEIRGDKRKLHQLVANLVSNALKYAKPGVPPEVSVSTHRDGSYTVLSIRDNGIGISEEHQVRIFHMFQRLHDSKEYVGTGIGLAICKKVAESLDASIEVNSKLGEGATFMVRFHNSLFPI